MHYLDISLYLQTRIITPIRNQVHMLCCQGKEKNERIPQRKIIFFKPRNLYDKQQMRKSHFPIVLRIKLCLYITIQLITKDEKRLQSSFTTKSYYHTNLSITLLSPSKRSVTCVLRGITSPKQKDSISSRLAVHYIYPTI